LNSQQRAQDNEDEDEDSDSDPMNVKLPQHQIPHHNASIQSYAASICLKPHLSLLITNQLIVNKLCSFYFVK